MRQPEARARGAFSFTNLNNLFYFNLLTWISNRMQRFVAHRVEIILDRNVEYVAKVTKGERRVWFETAKKCLIKSFFYDLPKIAKIVAWRDSGAALGELDGFDNFKVLD